MTKPATFRLPADLLQALSTENARQLGRKNQAQLVIELLRRVYELKTLAEKTQGENISK